MIHYSLVAAMLIAAAAPVNADELAAARERQDLAALEKLIGQLQASAGGQKSADNEYRLALAYSYAAEVAMEVRDKKKAEKFAESGMDPARKAIADASQNAEYHRVLGELCGQVVPANPFFGALKYGQCARDEVNRAIELNPKLALAYVSRGVGNSYLPPSMGGGLDLALKDFDKAIALDPKLADAYLWKGITLRKANRDGEARQALEKAVELDPQRVWAKQQLEKTPAR